MQIIDVDEKIKVGAVFEGPRVTPKWFFWGRHKKTIKSVEHTWRSRQGDVPLLFFSVTDGANVYEIRLNQKTLEWVLEKVYAEE
ncbi:MAG: hypothetical protein A2901_07510 [Elusimicrobia bacterium RIFCSPLOWO2_01_FULL_54_10]|nr:MAG: hypothetical protein A2901_07510 [Elusimicrobia bacterium RIFCSPLOWO2_01_FULL_54_10]